MTHETTDYMDAGKKYLTNDKDRAIVMREKESLTWVDIPCKSLPFLQGHAIKETINQFKLPATKIAYDGCLSGMSTERGASYGFYGIEASYNDGTTIKLYIVDDGVSISPVFVDVYRRDLNIS